MSEPSAGPLRLVCTDFDGTIAEADGAPIAPVFFERLRQWRERGTLYWVINTGRTLESLSDELIRRGAPIWPDWMVTLERQIWTVRDRRGEGWLDWNRRCELMHGQLFDSVKPVWKLIIDFIGKHTRAQLVQDSGSPLGIIAADEEEADEISAFMTPLLLDWPDLVPVRNSIYFRFSHRLYHKGACLEAISSSMQITPAQIFVSGDHLNDLPMMTRQYAHHLGCPGNSVDAVKKRIRAEGGRVAKKNVAEGTVEAWDFLLPLGGEKGKGER